MSVPVPGHRANIGTDWAAQASEHKGLRAAVHMSSKAVRSRRMSVRALETDLADTTGLDCLAEGSVTAAIKRARDV